jgi:hypothetical protein
MTFDITRSKSFVARWQHLARTASLLCGVLFLTSLANVAFATDPITVVDALLRDAIPAVQDTMASMSQGCHNGHGVPPLNWGTLQIHGDTAVNAFSAARTALATKQTPVAVQQINSGLSELDILVNGLHMNCSGAGTGMIPRTMPDTCRSEIT